jgi:tRNA 2-selenouridine synthase
MSFGFRDFLERRTAWPVVDVRSENEFLQGHVPGALNLPLLTHAERVQVGTDYKHQGQAAAIKTGFRLVGPRLADIISTAEKLAAGRNLLVYCWRGGMRSDYFCRFLAMANLPANALEGGYKAYRREVMAAFRKPYRLLTLGGCTGSGKTELLGALERAGEQVIDLEKLANHKGSVFGGLQQPPQPTTEQFQNNLFERLLLLDANRPVWVEDESVAIGNIFLPDDWWAQMRCSPILEIELPKERRVARLVQEYGRADPRAFVGAVRKISRKLGGLAARQIEDEVWAGNMFSAIGQLLNYYDRAYQNGLALKSRQGRIRARIQWDGENAEPVVQELQAHALQLAAAGA